jgi:hypothetical protein
MYVNQPHYLPVPLTFFSILVGSFRLFDCASSGQSPALRLHEDRFQRRRCYARAAWLVVIYFNIPVAQLPERHILSGHHVTFFEMPYVVPVVIDWPGTVVAANVGGALIPRLTEGSWRSLALPRCVTN